MAEVVYLGFGPINNPPDSVTPPNEVAQILSANLAASAEVENFGALLPPGNPDVNFFIAASQGGRLIGPVLVVEPDSADVEFGVTNPEFGGSTTFELLAVSDSSVPVANTGDPSKGVSVRSTTFPISLSNCTGFFPIGSSNPSSVPSGVIRMTPVLEITLG